MASGAQTTTLTLNQRKRRGESWVERLDEEAAKRKRLSVEPQRAINAFERDHWRDPSVASETDAPENEDGDNRKEAETSPRRKNIVRACDIQANGERLFAQLYPDLGEPAVNDPARISLQRSIALALQTVGFSSAEPTALERFTVTVEEYMLEIGAHIARNAAAARRTQAAPIDFELALPYYNLRPANLRKHLRAPPARLPDVSIPDPIPRTLFPPTREPDLPILTPALSSAQHRASLPYIPASFPSFPSAHTYRETLISDREADALLRGEQLDEAAEREARRRQMREQAVSEAVQAEQALRKVIRASKIRTHRANETEGRGAEAAGNPGALERYAVWERAMRAAMVREGWVPTAGEGGDEGRMPTAADIADVSVVVNDDRLWWRLQPGKNQEGRKGRRERI